MRSVMGPMMTKFGVQGRNYSGSEAWLLMRFDRRTFFGTSAGLAAAAMLPGRLLAQEPLLRKKIPSSGEEIPIIGLGTARRYEDPRTPEEMAPLRETFRRFAALGATVI